MVERFETDLIRRFQAGSEAIELLERAGFGISDADVNVDDLHDPHFTVEAELAVGEQTRPLQALEDEDEDDTEVGAEFALGLMAGLTAGSVAPCDLDDCPRGGE